MHLRALVFIAFASVMLLMPVPALATDCDHCAGKACAMKVPMSEDSRPVRESLTVWFMRPVKVADRILLGQYVIEHDTDRQARGEPCTHIYAAGDRRLPVLTFHCTHLTGTAPTRASVTLVPTGDPSGLMKFTAFQFAGDTAAHGVPIGR